MRAAPHPPLARGRPKSFWGPLLPAGTSCDPELLGRSYVWCLPLPLLFVSSVVLPIGLFRNNAHRTTVIKARRARAAPAPRPRRARTRTAGPSLPPYPYPYPYPYLYPYPYASPAASISSRFAVRRCSCGRRWCRSS